MVGVAIRRELLDEGLMKLITKSGNIREARPIELSLMRDFPKSGLYILEHAYDVDVRATLVLASLNLGGSNNGSHPAAR